MNAWPWLIAALAIGRTVGAVHMNLRWRRWLNTTRRPKPDPYIERTTDHDEDA